MSDLICRQAAIDALKEHRALYCDNTPDAFSKLSHAEKSRVDELDTAIATLVNLPPAEPKKREMNIEQEKMIVEALPSLYPLQEFEEKAIQTILDAIPKWIPVTERLPKEDGNYLVSGKWESGKESVGDCEFSVEDGYFQTAWNFDVLAWRELPEPYKGVTE